MKIPQFFFLYRTIGKWMTFGSSCSVELHHIWQYFPPRFLNFHILCMVHFSNPSFTPINACWWGCVWKTVQSALLQWFLLVILDGETDAGGSEFQIPLGKTWSSEWNLSITCLFNMASCQWHVVLFYIELKQQKVKGKFSFSFLSRD